MRKDKKDELKHCVYGLLESIERWKDIRDNGCNDPFWPDGTNMNLEANHVLAYKKRIKDICDELTIPYPEGYFLPTPPEVSECYMATLTPKTEHQKLRLRRLRQQGDLLTTVCPDYDDRQCVIEL